MLTETKPKYCSPCLYPIRIPPSPLKTLDYQGQKSSESEKRDKSATNNLGAKNAIVSNRYICLATKTKRKMSQLLHTAFVYNADLDTKKRWFVYYYVLDGATRKRIKISGGINYQKNPMLRQNMLAELQQQVQRKLSLGITNVTEITHPEKFADKSVLDYINRVVAEKNLMQKKYSRKTTINHMRAFGRWLVLREVSELPPQDIKPSLLLDYRNYLLTSGKSNRTVNNHFVDISAFFNHLTKRIDDYNHKNPCLVITKLPTRSETHVAFTQPQAQAIGNYLNECNPFLYLFCKFITYSFMRPSEISQLKINQIDLQSWTITRTAATEKTGKRKVQLIQEIFRPTILALNLHEYDPNLYLFGTQKKPGRKHMSYEYFRKHFKKVKDHFELSNKHTMYGLKHTFICQLRRNGATDDELMPITGHETKEALHKYLRDIGALKIKDLSSYYSFEF